MHTFMNDILYCFIYFDFYVNAISKLFLNLVLLTIFFDELISHPNREGQPQSIPD